MIPTCYYCQVFCDVSMSRGHQLVPSVLFRRKPVENSGSIAFINLVPNPSLSLNLSECMAYGLQRQVGVPVCTAGARKVLLKRGSCILMYALVVP